MGEINKVNRLASEALFGPRMRKREWYSDEYEDNFLNFIIVFLNIFYLETGPTSWRSFHGLWAFLAPCKSSASSVRKSNLQTRMAAVRMNLHERRLVCRRRYCCSSIRPGNQLKSSVYHCSVLPDFFSVLLD